MSEAIAQPLVAAGAALLGVLVGLLLGRLILPGPREVKRLRGEVERLGREHADYKTRVAGHFEKTGELIGQMTASYKAVYDHLADGAQALCVPGALSKPTFAAPRLIVDETVTIGARPATAATAPAPTPVEAPDAAARALEPHPLDALEAAPSEGAPVTAIER